MGAGERQERERERVRASSVLPYANWQLANPRNTWEGSLHMCESTKQGTLAGLLEAGYHSLVWLSVTDIPPEVTESKGYPEKESKAWLS